MVAHTMRKAFKKLESKKGKERSDVVGCRTKSSSSSLGASVIDPSHELGQQRQNSASSSNTVDSPFIHSAGLHSNPELHAVSSNWSSAASVHSFDSASVSECSTALDSPTMSRRDLDDDLDLDLDLDIMPYDFNMRQSPTRRRSTGSSRQRSQQKLARILGWNTSFPQCTVPQQSYSSENLSTPKPSPGSISSPLGRSIPMTWDENMAEEDQSESYDLQMRQYPLRRTHSVKDHTTQPDPTPYDFQMRQFLHAKPYKDQGVGRRRQDQFPPFARDFTPYRRSSAPDVHKPLPTTPAYPSFVNNAPPSSPLSASTMGSSSSRSDSSVMTTIPELSADEASHLLAQPDSTELGSEQDADRVELPDSSTLLPQRNARSKSPTHARSGSASSTVHDFGPGTTLSIIEEEPFEAEDLARMKVFELPAATATGLVAGAANQSSSSNGSCPGLSPSSSLSSKRLSKQDEEAEESLEAEISDSATTSTARSVGSNPSRTNEPDAASNSEREGEEVVIIMDRGNMNIRNLSNQDMTGKSFLALDEDETDDSDREAEDDDDTEDGSDTDTEERVRRRRSDWSYRVGDDTMLSVGRRASGFSHKRSSSQETSKTAWTATSERTIVDPDYRHDLAKQMDFA